MHENPPKTPDSSDNEKEQKKPDSFLEIKEGEPKIHTVYAYIKKAQVAQWSRIDEVMGLYTNKETPMTLAHLDNMFATEDDIVVPLHVYEREEDLPEEIRKRIRPTKTPEIVKKEEGMIYAILPNTDPTEGNGRLFIWALVTDPGLAYKIALGNGPSGGKAEVVAFPLNKKLPSEVSIRWGKDNTLTDELYG